jgi:hypothetical protein
MTGSVSLFFFSFFPNFPNFEKVLLECPLVRDLLENRKKRKIGKRFYQSKVLANQLLVFEILYPFSFLCLK